MRFAVIRFPGSNCDEDCVHALHTFEGVKAERVWHKDRDLSSFDAIVLPGGFSYGDYLRCGAIARLSPVMASVMKEAERGKLVIGICNGFQILCESRMLPGALIKNRDLQFICQDTHLLVETNDSPFTNTLTKGTILRMPIAHGEGCYYADEATLEELNRNNQILLRYATPTGKIVHAANPNGSAESIAGICNLQRNVFGLMPHPERACEPLLGSTDGRAIFASMLAAFSSQSSSQLSSK